MVPRTNQVFDISFEFPVKFYAKNMFSKYDTFSIIAVKTINYVARNDQKIFFYKIKSVTCIEKSSILKL